MEPGASVQKPKIDAIMTAADQIAIGVNKYLKEQKIRIPDDISLVSFDNNAICAK